MGIEKRLANEGLKQSVLCYMPVRLTCHGLFCLESLSCTSGMGVEGDVVVDNVLSAQCRTGFHPHQPPRSTTMTTLMVASLVVHVALGP